MDIKHSRLIVTVCYEKGDNAPGNPAPMYVTLDCSNEQIAWTHHRVPLRDQESFQQTFRIDSTGLIKFEVRGA